MLDRCIAFNTNHLSSFKIELTRATMILLNFHDL
jgi:hypothetical protein